MSPIGVPNRVAIARWVQDLPAAHKDQLLTDILLAETHHPVLALKQRAEVARRRPHRGR